MNNPTPKIVGYSNRLGAEPQVEPWAPLSRQATAALAPLAPPPQRGWHLAAPAASESSSASAPAAAAVAPPSPLRLPADLPPDSAEALALQRPEEAAGVLRALLIAHDAGPAQSEDGDTLQKAAVLCVALGQDLTGELMKHLGDAEIETLTGAIGRILNISAEARKGALDEFRRHMLEGEWVSRGGTDFCRSALERAVGPQRARELTERLGVSSGFYMMRDASPEQVAPFIANEHPQTVALILSQLNPEQAAGILGYLQPALQVDVVRRITNMDNVSQTVLRQIEESLERSLRDVLGDDADVGGPKVAADILNCAGSAVERDVLQALDGSDKEQAEAIRNLMFVFADLEKLSDKELQAVLREVEQKDLVVALKAANEAVMKKVLSNCSERVQKFLTEEIEFLGPMRLSEVEEVQLRIVHVVQRLEAEGRITVRRGERGNVEDQFV